MFTGRPGPNLYLTPGPALPPGVLCETRIWAQVWPSAKTDLRYGSQLLDPRSLHKACRILTGSAQGSGLKFGQGPIRIWPYGKSLTPDPLIKVL